MKVIRLTQKNYDELVGALPSDTMQVLPENDETRVKNEAGRLGPLIFTIGKETDES